MPAKSNFPTFPWNSHATNFPDMETGVPSLQPLTRFHQHHHDTGFSTLDTMGGQYGAATCRRVRTAKG